MVTFSTNSDIDMEKWMQRAGVASPFSKERGRVRLGLVPSASRFEQLCELAFVGSQTPHLNPLPFCKGRSDKNPCVWASVAARFHEK
jgi:hypothetical protein